MFDSRFFYYYFYGCCCCCFSIVFYPVALNYNRLSTNLTCHSHSFLFHELLSHAFLLLRCEMNSSLLVVDVLSLLSVQAVMMAMIDWNCHFQAIQTVLFVDMTILNHRYFSPYLSLASSLFTFTVFAADFVFVSSFFFFFDFINRLFMT